MKDLSYFIVLISFFSISSCNNEYLEEYPPDKISDIFFWKTASDIQMFSNQFYPDLLPINGLARRDNQSDNCVPAARVTYIWNEYTIPVSGGGWGKIDWQKIRSCNIALNNIAQMEKDAEVLQYEGEIRFFRAFYYFDKVKMFGDVPWYNSDLQTDSEELYKPRDSRKMVFGKLLDDLDFSIDYLPEESAGNRLTKYAALAFKTQACLYEGTFRKYHSLGDYEDLLRESANAAEQIISSGLFELYSTNNIDKDYYDMFVQYDKRGNPESIMVEVFLKDIRMNNDGREAHETSTGYSKDFVNSYLCIDGLPISLSPHYKGDTVFGDEFENRDPRMIQSINHPDRIYRIFEDGSYIKWPMPDFSATYCPTSYIILKRHSAYEKDREQNQCIIDRFIFRYGQVLVSYAEAKAELGECTQKVLDKSINLLRDRVGMPHLTTDVGFIDPKWPDWEISVSPLINEIRRERRIELCVEGFRWDDIVRWKAGKLLENPLTYLGARDPSTGNYRVLYPGFTRVWDDKLYLHPIPTQELTLNLNLEQNPGWN